MMLEKPSHDVAFCCPPGHEARDDRFSLFQALSSHKPPERRHRTIHDWCASLATEYRTLRLLTDVRLRPRVSHGSRRRAKLDLARRADALLLDGRGHLLHALDELRAGGTFGRSRPRLRMHDAAAHACASPTRAAAGLSASMRVRKASGVRREKRGSREAGDHDFCSVKSASESPFEASSLGRRSNGRSG